MFVLVFVGLQTHDLFYLVSLCKLNGFCFTKDARFALKFHSLVDARYNQKLLYDETLLPLSIVDIDSLCEVSND